MNLMSALISELAIDVNSVRHAALQNRAAIDFLLLAWGHGCEDFEGMCCMNLSDHSKSIHKQLKQLKDLAKDLKREKVPHWLRGLLSGWGITRWLQELILRGGMVLLMILIVVMILPCFLQCIQGMIQ